MNKEIKNKIIYGVDYEYYWRTWEMDFDEYNTGIQTEFFDTYEEAIEYVNKNKDIALAIHKYEECEGWLVNVEDFEI